MSGGGVDGDGNNNKLSPSLYKVDMATAAAVLPRDRGCK